MQIPGHLAVALAQSNLPLFRRGPRRLLVTLLIASLFPDVVDKSIGYVFHAMPNGRHYAHNVFSLAGVSLLIGLLWGRAAGYAWFIGYLGHLLADCGGLVPWYFPLKKYPFEPSELTFKPMPMLREALLLGLVLVIRQSNYQTKWIEGRLPDDP